MIKMFCAMALSLSLGQAFAAKSCDELKSEIEAKMKGHGVQAPALSVVGKDEAKDGKVVGTCEAGTKSIVYKKG